MDLFCFYLKSLANEGVMAVFPKITFLKSRDRKYVKRGRKWHHAVPILLATILALREVSSSITD